MSGFWTPAGAWKGATQYVLCDMRKLKGVSLCPRDIFLVVWINGSWSNWNITHHLFGLRITCWKVFKIALSAKNGAQDVHCWEWEDQGQLKSDAGDTSQPGGPRGAGGIWAAGIIDSIWSEECFWGFAGGEVMAKLWNSDAKEIAQRWKSESKLMEQ